MGALNLSLKSVPFAAGHLATKNNQANLEGGLLTPYRSPLEDLLLNPLQGTGWFQTGHALADHADGICRQIFG